MSAVAERVSISRPSMAQWNVTIEGTTSLLVAHRLPWDLGGSYWETQRPEIGRNKVKLPTEEQIAILETLGKPFTDPERGLNLDQEVLLRGHWLPDVSPGFPAVAFKGALLRALTTYQGKSKNALKATRVSRQLDIEGDPHAPDLVRLEGGYRVRQEMGRDSGMSRSPRLITRLEFPAGWRALLSVLYLPSMLDQQQVAQLLNWAGMVGVGQWSGSADKGGTHGRFTIVES